MDLLTCQGIVDGCVQFCWPSSPAPWLRVRHQVEVQDGEVVSYG
jgi:hypothetical protein